jgi:acetate kinase
MGHYFQAAIFWIFRNDNKLNQNAIIIALSSGSSSLKFALFEASELAHKGLAAQAVFRGQFSAIGAGGHWQVLSAGQTIMIDEHSDFANHQQALQTLLRWTQQTLPDATLAACGHRIVHGGEKFSRPVSVTDDVIDYLKSLTPLAPNHQPAGLLGIEAVHKSHPGLPQVACFDTAFHHSRSSLEQRFALPDWPELAGVKRYGFHGLSYEYIASRLPQVLQQRADGKVVVAHLGHGASLCALHNRQSVATSMTFTPLDGLPMGKRCGALDPAVVLYLLQQGMSADEISELLYFKSGLLGLSGISDDVSTLLDSTAPAAKFALDYFTHHCAKSIAAMAAAMGGIDDLVFTAGIGENSATLRAEIAGRCAWLGLEIDPQANLDSSPNISTSGSLLQAWVIPTDEELMIARHTRQVLQNI